MTITLWGVRGSIPCPGPKTVRYGGNTLCLELRYGPDNRYIIIDAGSGIRPLGGKLMGTEFPKGPIKTKIFFSHTHWDHIMGFPFFIPLFIPTSELEVFGPVTFEDEPLDNVIGGQMQYRYFPVTMAELSAKLTYHRLQETEWDLDEHLHIRTKFLNHPITNLGYRFTSGGKTIVTMYDHEPYRNLFVTDPAHPDYDEEVATEGEQAAAEENEKIVEFMRGADVVLHDAQYTEKEYRKGKVGWGHCSMEAAINQAHKAGVKKLILFHHDPERTDDQIDELEAFYQKMIAGKSTMELQFGREGMVL